MVISHSYVNVYQRVRRAPIFLHVCQSSNPYLLITAQTQAMITWCLGLVGQSWHPNRVCVYIQDGAPQLRIIHYCYYSYKPT